MFSIVEREDGDGQAGRIYPVFLDGFLDQVIEMGMRLAGRFNYEDRRVQGQGLIEQGNGEKMKIELPNM